MRLGTPGFVGARLRQVREARGISSPALADLLGVSRQTISQYELDEQTPRPEIMERLPVLLNVKSRFFFRPMEPDDETPLFYRSLSAATKTARARARRRQEWLVDVIRFVEQYVELPAPRLPDLGLPTDPLQITYPMIEEAATAVRRFWGLGDGAISDLALLLENHGIVIARGELWSDLLDAFSRWRNGRPFVFLGEEKESAVRSRFDAAHELAHIVLHRSVSDEMLARKPIFKRVEEQANYFAGAFLMPPESFAADVRVPSLELFRALKPTWKVSIGAMLMRSVQLGLVADPAPLYRSYARRGWRREEPLDRELAPEVPRLLRRAIELLLQEQVISREEILSRFDISGKDIEELAGLPDGFLAPRAEGVRLLQLPTGRRREAQESAVGLRAHDVTVYRFPTARHRSGD